MGNRANVRIVESTGKAIYVYTHWNGSEFPEMLQGALKFSQDRWHDEPYFQRCIITELCKSATGTTGFGVTTYLQDNGHQVLEVDWTDQEVRLWSCDGWHDGEMAWLTQRKKRGEWTFSQYLELRDQLPW